MRDTPASSVNTCGRVVLSTPAVGTTHDATAAVAVIVCGEFATLIVAAGTLHEAVATGAATLTVATTVALGTDQLAVACRGRLQRGG